MFRLIVSVLSCLALSRLGHCIARFFPGWSWRGKQAPFRHVSLSLVPCLPAATQRNATHSFTPPAQQQPPQPPPPPRILYTPSPSLLSSPLLSPLSLSLSLLVSIQRHHTTHSSRRHSIHPSIQPLIRHPSAHLQQTQRLHCDYTSTPHNLWTHVPQDTGIPVIPPHGRSDGFHRQIQDACHPVVCRRCCEKGWLRSVSPLTTGHTRRSFLTRNPDGPSLRPG